MQMERLTEIQLTEDDVSKGEKMHESMDIERVIEDVLARTLAPPEALQAGDDFFDHGANSLTILELQIQVEHELKLAASTSELMAEPTLHGWCRIYRAVVGEADAPKRHATSGERHE